MRGTATGKVVTSGRLTRGGRVQLSRRRTPQNPGAAVRAEPAYSLYSTDSEDQVTNLHRGLDRCAALLGGMLQAEKAETLPGLTKGVTLRAAKSRPSTLLRKKTIGNTDQRSRLSVQRGPAAAAVSPQKLLPPQKRAPTLLPHKRPPTPPPLSDPQSASEAPPTSCLSDGDGEEEECVPVRDTDTHPAVRQTHSHTCSVQKPDTMLEPGQVAMVTEDTQSVGGRRTVQHLLEELKALITGQGSTAERLLSHLEQSLSSQLMDVGGPVQTAGELSSVQNQNCQLRRRVRVLNQQLREREKAALHGTEPFINSAVCALQEQLEGAQSQLQELQEELTGVREALRDTQSQLRDREEENTLLTADLEATRSRLRDSEREKTEYSSLAQQQLEERENCNRVLQILESTQAGVLPQQQRQEPPVPPPDRITHFLLSLAPPMCVSAERGGHTATSVSLRDTSSHPAVVLTDQSLCPDEAKEGGWGLLSHVDSSVCSDWSSRSGSTLDSRAEAAFRDGLAALDASIASLQRTFQLDLGGAR